MYPNPFLGKGIGVTSEGEGEGRRLYYIHFNSRKCYRLCSTYASSSHLPPISTKITHLSHLFYPTSTSINIIVPRNKTKPTTNSFIASLLSSWKLKLLFRYSVAVLNDAAIPENLLHWRRQHHRTNNNPGGQIVVPSAADLCRRRVTSHHAAPDIALSRFTCIYIFIWLMPTSQQLKLGQQS